MYFSLKYIDYHDFRKQPEHHPASTIQISKTKADELKSNSATRALSRSRSRSLSMGKPSVVGSAVEVSNELNTSSISSSENKEVLINPDCYLGSILDYIREVAGLPKNHNQYGYAVFFPLLNKHSERYSYFMSKFKNDVVENQRKHSTTNSSSTKLKPKDTGKAKSRVKSAAPQKEGKSQTTTLPPIKQKN